MDLVKEIENIAQSIGMSFMFNDWAKANVDLDSQLQQALTDDKYPLCLFLCPVSGTIDVNANGRFASSYSCLIGFLDKTMFDGKSETSFEIVQKMNKYARRFIEALNNSKKFDYVTGSLSLSIPYDILDINLTGVLLDIVLKEKYYQCV